MALGLKAYRVAKKLNQQDLADMIGRSLTTICHWEKDPSSMTYKDMINISNALDVPASVIFFAEEHDKMSSYRGENERFVDRNHKNDEGTR